MLSLLITAGSTREPIDSLHYLAHRDPGRLGVGLAWVAAESGHRVTLLLAGQDGSSPIPGVHVHPCGSGSELRQLLLAHQAGHDVVILTATLPAWRSVSVLDGVLMAEPDAERIVIELQKTADPAQGVVTCKRPGQRLIVLRQGVCPGGTPASGIDAEIWQNPAPDATSVEPTWLDAKGAVSPGRIRVEQWGGWVLERVTAKV